MCSPTILAHLTYPPLAIPLCSILGPIVGGYLSYPARTLPSWFPPGSLLDVYPFLLPAIASAMVSAYHRTHLSHRLPV